MVRDVVPIMSVVKIRVVGRHLEMMGMWRWWVVLCSGRCQVVVNRKAVERRVVLDAGNVEGIDP